VPEGTIAPRFRAVEAGAAREAAPAALIAASIMTLPAVAAVATVAAAPVLRERAAARAAA
jgi:hypothetical protein